MAADPDAVSVYFTDKTVERFAVVVRRPGAEWLAAFKDDALGGDGGSAVRAESVKLVEAETVTAGDDGTVVYAADGADVDAALAVEWLDADR